MTQDEQGGSAVERAFSDYLGVLADHASVLRLEARTTLERGARQARGLGWTQRRIADALGRSQPEIKRLLDRADADQRPAGSVSAPGRSSVLDEVLRVHRDDIVAAAARHGVRQVRLFGSVAAGTSGEDSDVDLLVDLDDGVGLFALGALEVELEGLLGRPVDVVPERSLRPVVRESVRAIPL